jgi:hypothetical protein
MLTAGRRGLGDFGQLLPVIDRMVAEGRQLTDGAMLAAILLPKILLRRDDIEAEERRPMSRSAIATMIEEEIQPFLARLTVSNLKSTQILQALIGFQRLCEPNWSPGERVRFSRKSFFDNALLLFEMLVEATGEGGEALAEWQAAAHRRAAPPAADGARRGRPRRRRRRQGQAL